MDCQRRRLLGLAGAGVGTLAGCLDGFGSEPTDSPTPDEGTNDYPTARPNDVDGTPPCPDYGDDVDRVVCSDAVDVESDPDRVVLEPSRRRVEVGSSIEFTLRNGSDRRLATNFYNWRLDKYVDGAWYRVAPLGYNQPLMYLEPGERHTWTVTLDNDGIADGGRVGRAGGTDKVTIAGVGPGAYAFRARGWFDGARSAGILAFATTFELEGEALELTPTDAIESLERTEDDGREVLVAQSSRGEPTDEDRRLGSYELEVIDEPAGGDSDDDGPRSMITEQVIRHDWLRNAIALSHAHDISTVRIEAYDGSTPIFGRAAGRYEYQGTYYRVRTRELEDG